MSRVAAVIVALVLFVPAFANAQRKPARPKDLGPKPDLLTLRYKPQAGTLLYNIHTEITQHVRDEQNNLHGSVRANAQLAIHNVSVDYAKGLWSFDRYFTSFEITGEDLLGNKLKISEPAAVNKITRFTYLMTGSEVKREELDSIRLLNADAQTFAYFIRPPALLFPLPEHLVTYNDTWQEHTSDTIIVRDTVNVGVTQGHYVYNIDRTYRLDRLADSVGSNIAIIVATNTGSFVGTQSNTVTGLTVALNGPLTGVDTIYLSLFSGRVIKRLTSLEVPVKVTTEGRPPIQDILDMRRTMVLDESNAVHLHD
jgi:hypothetical protein